MTPNLHLYKMNETELRTYIKGILDEREIEYLEHRGNIFSVRFPEAPLFVAHMDTVGEATVRSTLKISKNTLTRKGRVVLGADDKAGVDILLNYIDTINFCFTVDEEIGCLGATDLYTYEPFLDGVQSIPCAIEYDRRNNADLIPYCGQNLIDKVEELTHYRKAHGLFTDVTQWEDIIPSVNLSVGYYHAHTGEEFLNIKQWQVALATLPILREIRGTFDLAPPSVYPKYGKYDNWDTYGYNNGYDWGKDYNYPSNFQSSTPVIGDSWEDALKTCDHCGKKEDLATDFFEVSGYDLICDKCLNELYDIRKV